MVSSVTIHNPTFMDSGVYVCNAENIVGVQKISHRVQYASEEEFFYDQMLKEKAKERSQALNEKLKAEKEAQAQEDNAPGEMMKPRKKVDGETSKNFSFVSHLINRTVPGGKTVKISCCVNSDDAIEVNWFRNDRPIKDSVRNSITTTKEGMCSLEISKARTTDSARYKCVATSGLHGEISTECDVLIFDLASGDQAPTFTRNISGKSISCRNYRNKSKLIT